MIRVVIEVWSEDKKMRVIAEGLIRNTGEGSKSSGVYQYSLRSKDKRFREGRVKGFERLRQNVWYLLWRVLKDAIWAKQGISVDV